MKTARHLAIVTFLVWIIIAPIPSLAENSEECLDDFQKTEPSQSTKGYELIEPQKLKGDCVSELFVLFKQFAEDGDAEGAFNVGTMYSLGLGTPKNDKSAAKWFMKAAKQGVPDAQYNLGVLYLHGRGPIQNYVEAYSWFNLAAAAGDDEASDARERVAERMTVEQIAEAQESSIERFEEISEKTEE